MILNSNARWYDVNAKLVRVSSRGTYSSPNFEASSQYPALPDNMTDYCIFSRVLFAAAFSPLSSFWLGMRHAGGSPSPRSPLFKL